jgi:hypothetical protein
LFDENGEPESGEPGNRREAILGSIVRYATVAMCYFDLGCDQNAVERILPSLRNPSDKAGENANDLIA